MLRCLSGDKIDISFKSAILREVIEGMSGYKNDSNNRRTNPDINIEAADKYVLAGNIYYKTKKIDSEKLSKSIVQKLLGHFVNDVSIQAFFLLISPFLYRKRTTRSATLLWTISLARRIPLLRKGFST